MFLSLFFCCFLLLGIQYIGCYLLPHDRLKSLELVNISMVNDTTGNSYTYGDKVSMKDKVSMEDILKECGKIAQRGGYSIFGLRGNLCFIDPSNKSTLTEGGSSQLCKDDSSPQLYLEGEVAINVYMIVDTQNFELSVRAYETCGSNFCQLAGKGEKLLCSAGTCAKHHLLTTIFQVMFMLMLWSL